MLRRQIFRTVVSNANQFRLLSITPVFMPSLSPTMENGKITEWSIKLGTQVSGGETYGKIETDKAVVAFDNTADEGFIARFLVDAPTDAVKVGEPVLLLVDEASGVDSAEVKNWKPAAAAASSATPVAPAATPVVAAAPAATPAAASGARVFASPIAKVTAGKLGVNLASVVGTGGAVGRITKRDVEAAASATGAPVAVAAPAAVASVAPVATPVATTKSAPAAAAATAEADYTTIPVTSMRATIAKRLTQSKNVEVPHYYLMNECKAANMLSVIKQLNAKGAGSFKISVNDFIVKAVARANLLVPAVNSAWHGDVIRQYKGVDVSIAVATPTGLITPIIKNAHIKGLAEISIESKELAKKARDGALQPNEFIGGTVSVSNLGASGIPSFTAIINPPQAAILAVGTIVQKPEISQNEEGEFVMTGKVESVINFTASFDHRVVDGAIGAEWFKHFKDAIENPLSLLL